ncbi:MAG: DUF3459 domain-containing protein [Cellvibrionales bacterium]|nr:DUF3459 domain-containing protein [Cellvibrionales bacterium]
MNHAMPSTKPHRLTTALLLATLAGCTPAPKGPDQQAAPATPAAAPPTAAPPTAPTPDANFRSRAVIYEVNVRQFSDSGTLAAVTQDLPRIRDLGVNVLWLMPIHPIGIKNRKGELGSYYSVRDYRAINPEFGTLDDLRQLVRRAHELEMLVILDWVANHTAWDHAWITEHPDRYTRNAAGKIIDPIGKDGKSWGWTDVADLNYENRALWEAMTAEMAFWIQEANIDGFRCDVASEVPAAFWEFALPRLRQIKPLFMLAEAEETELQASFDLSYGWHFHHLTNEVAQGRQPATVFDSYMQERQTQFNADHPLLMFTTNHDENSWNGTVFERYGAAHKAWAVLAFTLDGVPLLYSGQEAGLDRRLRFFERDPIDWGDYRLADFYRDLLTLRAQTPALLAGATGGRFAPIDHRSDNERAYAFTRTAADGSGVLVALNFSAAPANLDFAQGLETYPKTLHGTAERTTASLTLAPHQWVILEKQK